MKKSLALAFVSATLLLAGNAYAAETITAKTSGLTCDACADTVKSKLAKEAAVEEVSVDIESGTIIVTIRDGAVFTDEELEAVIDWAGYEVLTLDRTET